MQDELSKMRARNPLSPEEQAYFRRVSQQSQEAERLLEQDDVRGALRAAEEALRRAGRIPPFIHYANTLSPAYMRAGDYEKAASLFGFKADPRNPILNAALAFVMTGRLGEARKSYREVQLLAYHPEFKPYLPGSSTAKDVEATVFLGRGFTYNDYGKHASAVWALEHAVKLIPRNPLALCCYAEALAKRGRKPEARRDFEAAIRLDGSGTIGRRARAGLAQVNLFRI
jgi:tetratricopeptide (TPR) repeat protein